MDSEPSTSERDDEPVCVLCDGPVARALGTYRRHPSARPVWMCRACQLGRLSAEVRHEWEVQDGLEERREHADAMLRRPGESRVGEPVCAVCGEAFLRRSPGWWPPDDLLIQGWSAHLVPSPVLCRACWLAVKMHAQVRWLFSARTSDDLPRNVGDVYLAISSLLHGARPEDYADDPDAGAEAEQWRADLLTALAIVAARRWRLRGRGRYRSTQRTLLEQRARELDVSDTDLVKIDLCREGFVSALKELEAGGPGRWRLAQQTSKGKLADEEIRRALRVIFNRAIRAAQNALEAAEVGEVVERDEYRDGVTGRTPADDGLGEADEDQDEADDRTRALWVLLEAAATDSRQQELVKAKREHRPLAAVARELGMTPNAAWQAWHRIKRRARKSAR